MSMKITKQQRLKEVVFSEAGQVVPKVLTTRAFPDDFKVINACSKIPILVVWGDEALQKVPRTYSGGVRVKSDSGLAREVPTSFVKF